MPFCEHIQLRLLKLVDDALDYIGIVRKRKLVLTLDFARDVAKRLDEHRETVEAIEAKTRLFDDWWHVVHLATQDDYLMRLYYFRYGCWPSADSTLNSPGFVRKRPEILGSCRLPEYNPDLAIDKSNFIGC